MTIRALRHFERSPCSCEKCLAPCMGAASTGAIAPGEIDHIAEEMGHDEATSAFIFAHFEACADGPKAPSDKYPDGRTPAIRPRVDDDSGNCVFFDPDKQLCKLGNNKPFECGVVNQCEHPPQGSAALKMLGAAISRSPDYCNLWWWLWNQQDKEKERHASQEKPDR